MEHVGNSPYYINIDFCELQQTFHYSYPYRYSAKEDRRLIAEGVLVSVAIAFDYYLNINGPMRHMTDDDVYESFTAFKHFLLLLEKKDIHLGVSKKYKTIKDLI